MIQNVTVPNLDQIFQENKVSFEDFAKNPIKILENRNLLIRFDDKLFDWTSAAPLMLSLLAFKRPLPHSVMKDLASKRKNIKRSPLMISGSPKPIQSKFVKSMSNPTSPNVGPKISPFPSSDFELDSVGDDIDEENLRTEFLTPEQLNSLNLNDGENEIEFIVISQIQGKQSIKSRIYLWDFNSKIIVSDIDGTITRSDIMGQLMPIIGQDWSHPGVAELYQHIYKNGYKLLYLSSRAIGLADFTRSYLDNLSQKGVRLPKGPLIISPDRVISAVMREVIARRPQEFKITALRTIKNAFPASFSPFCGGFGNRETDVFSYRAVGMDLHKVFIINSEGVVQSGYNLRFSKTYPLITEIVDFIFPSIQETLYSFNAQYSDLNYWRPFNEGRESLLSEDDIKSYC